MEGVKRSAAEATYEGSSDDDVGPSLRLQQQLELAKSESHAEVAKLKAALSDGAPLVHDDRPGNLCFHWRAGDLDKVDAALGTATHRVTSRAPARPRLTPAVH